MAYILNRNLAHVHICTDNKLRFPPVLLQNTRFIFLTPLYAFLFVSIIGYAIVKLINF